MRSTSEQAKARRACFAAHKKNDANGRLYLDCHLCGGRIDPAVEAWEADHVLRHVLSQNDDPSNVRPSHIKCHRAKTDVDVSENAKGKQISEKHFGVKRKGWGGKYKKKLSGEVVLR